MRGVKGTQQTNLPKLHIRGKDNKALCGAKRKFGILFASLDYESDCGKCKKKLPSYNG
jgi:hypothetical protein